VRNFKYLRSISAMTPSGAIFRPPVHREPLATYQEAIPYLPMELSRESNAGPPPPTGRSVSRATRR